MMSKRYRLGKYLLEDENQNRNVLDSDLESIYQKTDKLATTMEKYANDLVKLDKRIKDKFENEGMSIDEYMKVSVALKLMLNRLEDMEKHIDSLENLNL